MAMAQQPRVLLLDEPTQGLWVEETEQAVDTLARFLQASRMTVLLVEHDMEVVFRLAHRITVLHRGAVIADGAPDQVKADPACRTPISGASSDAEDRGHEHALRRQPRPAGRRPRHAAGPHQRRAWPNGVGKTTMVKTIMGLVVLSGGRVAVGGTDITGWPPHRVAREGVAYVPEGRLIFPDLTRGREYPGRASAGPAPPGRSHGCSSCSPRCASAPAAGARSSRAASSRCWRSPGRWCPIPR